MSTEPDSNQKPANSEYAIGQDNVRWLGLDVHNPVFFVSATLVVTFVAITIIFLDSAGAAFSDLRIWITTKFDWVFMISMNFFVLFGLFIAYSKLGRIRLGGANAKPKYSYPAWLAMLFSAGVGIGLMFFGVLEPVTHSLNPPLGIDPNDIEAATSAGMSAAILHGAYMPGAFMQLSVLRSLSFASTAACR